MDKQYLNRTEISQRIKVLNDWLKENPNDPMFGTVKSESLKYVNLLNKIEDLCLDVIENTVRTEVYQQIGILI